MEFVTILLLLFFYVLVLWLWAMWDLSSPIRDQTHISCIGRGSLNHWTTREIPICILKKKKMIPHMSDIIWYLSFSVWRTLLSMLISTSTHVAANDIISFFFIVQYYSIEYMHYIFFINSSVYWNYVASILAILNNAAKNLGVHVIFLIMVFSRYKPRSGISRSYGSSIFSFLSSLHTVPHSGWANLHSHISVGRFPFLHTFSTMYCL